MELQSKGDIMWSLHGIIALILCCGTLIGVVEYIFHIIPADEEILFAFPGIKVTRVKSSWWRDWSGMIGVIAGGIVGMLYLYVAYEVICWREGI